METQLSPAARVADLALALPGAAAVFEHLGIDFCCGGGKSLESACQAKGLEVQAVLGALEAGRTQPAPADAHWQSEPLPALLDYIVQRHHGYVREAVPRLDAWLAKVIAAHGSRHPELLAIRHTFTAMAGELAQHMAKEELVLFPAIRQLGTASAGMSVAAPVERMIAEHEHAGRDLEEIRRASGDFIPPPDACATFRACYQGLEEFAADLRRHVHLENNILFPRALGLERRASPDA